MKRYWVYILASISRRLYAGVTNDIHRRVRQHRSGDGSEFTSRYRIHRLVYCEETADIRAAIAREKQIKGWRREKKVGLIESANPLWIDLAADWGAEADSPLHSE
jgi:putative endonuclease